MKLGSLFQKVLFSMSTSAPILVCTGIVVWVQQSSDYFLPISLIMIGVISSLYSLIYILVFQKNMAVTKALISELSPNDKWAIIYFLTYIIPFASLTVKDFNVFVMCLILFIVVFFLSLSNYSMPSPLLLLFGFHFYIGQHEGGTTDYCIISRRKGIYDPKSIRQVCIVFDYFIIEKR